MFRPESILFNDEGITFLQVATADHFESRSEDEDEYDLGEMETEAEEERDIFEMPPISTIVGRAQRSGMVAIHYDYETIYSDSLNCNRTMKYVNTRPASDAQVE